MRMTLAKCIYTPRAGMRLQLGMRLRYEAGCKLPTCDKRKLCYIYRMMKVTALSKARRPKLGGVRPSQLCLYNIKAPWTDRRCVPCLPCADSCVRRAVRVKPFRM